MSLRERVAKHLPGEHDQGTHGAWARGARHFDGRAAAHAWGREHYGAWQQTLGQGIPLQQALLSNEAWVVFTGYRGSNYDQINRYLRGQMSPTERANVEGPPRYRWTTGRVEDHWVKQDIKVLDENLARAPALPEAMVMYRGMQSGILDHLQPGDEFTDSGFASASLVEAQAMQFAVPVLAIIQVPEGARGAYISDTSLPEVYTETEFLFRRGTRFRVLSTDAGHHFNPTIGDQTRNMDIRHVLLEVVNG